MVMMVMELEMMLMCGGSGGELGMVVMARARFLVVAGVAAPPPWGVGGGWQRAAYLNKS